MLHELQAGVRAAIFAGDARVGEVIVADGIAPAGRLAIYRHHVLTTLTEALIATYPVVCRLVDHRFFAYAADRFIRDHPPASPCLFEYGAASAEFLAAYAPCRHLAYLPDVARMEWAMNLAARRRRGSREPRAAGGADTGCRRRVGVRAAPVGHVARLAVAGGRRVAGQPAGGDRGGGRRGRGRVRLQVWRSGDDVLFRRLSAPAAALREAIRAGRSLHEAAHAALAIDGAGDLPALLREPLDERVLVERARSSQTAPSLLNVSVRSPALTVASQVTGMAAFTLSCAGQPCGCAASARSVASAASDGTLSS